MKLRNCMLVGLSALLTLGCKEESRRASKPSISSNIKPPMAAKKPFTYTIHGDTIGDNYNWMRLTDSQKNAKTADAQTTEVLAYLEAENQYKDSVMAHTKELQDTLYEEMVGRVRKDDSSVPYSKNGYSYFTRYEEGKDYPYYCRKKLTVGATEEVMIDGPKMATGKSYFGIGTMSVSPGNKLLAYSVDTVSRRQYNIYFKDLASNTLLPDVLTNTGGDIVWANDNKTVFYTLKDPITLRAAKIYKHRLGTSQKEDELVYDEVDDTFTVYVTKSRPGDYIFIVSDQTVSDEVQYLDANKPEGKFKVIQPRERDLRYSVSQVGKEFYIRTNKDADNYKLVKTPISKPTTENWVDVIPHREDIFLDDVTTFSDYLVLGERKNGLREIRVMKYDGSGDHYLKFDEPAYTVYPMTNEEFETNTLRYIYTSLTTPYSTIEYDMDKKEKNILKVQEVVGNTFSRENYTSERRFVSARDGAKVPVCYVHRRDIKLSSETPIILYAYGSYGYSRDAYFSSARLSLLDRGLVLAIASVRGGQEMGRHWYEDGKLLKKKNTFYDFIDVTKYMHSQGISSPKHTYASGVSAGGLLMGAVLNMAPESYNGVIAAVPFVDVISTMLDETIPLTTFEFDEWGNPKDKEYYDYIRTYSPYDNVEAKDYPNILVITGYWDSQVQYWEPAKWVAKLRELKTDNNLLILDTDMEAGHGGASGRFNYYKTLALEYAFMMDLEGIDD